MRIQNDLKSLYYIYRFSYPKSNGLVRHSLCAAGWARLGQVRQFGGCFFLRASIYVVTNNSIHVNTPCVPIDLYHLTHTKSLVLHVELKKLLELLQIWPIKPAVPIREHRSAAWRTSHTYLVDEKSPSILLSFNTRRPKCRDTQTVNQVPIINWYHDFSDRWRW